MNYEEEKKVELGWGRSAGQKLFFEENDKILISSIKLRFSLQN